jgi:hypothetical protein
MIFGKSWRRKSRKELETQVKKQRNALIYSNAIYIIGIVLLILALQLDSARYEKMNIAAAHSIMQLDKCHRILSNLSEECTTVAIDDYNYMKNLSDKLNSTISNYKNYLEKYMDCDTQLSIQTSYTNNMPFIKSIEEFAISHEYDINTFNCVDFSNGAVGILSEMGYDSYLRTVKVNCSSGMFGCPFGNNRHAIVMLELPIEVTGTLFIIPPELFHDYGLAQDGSAEVLE